MIKTKQNKMAQVTFTSYIPLFEEKSGDLVKCYLWRKKIYIVFPKKEGR